MTGTVTDSVTGQPAAGAVITARRVDEWGESFAATDAAGRFRLVVPEGRYDFLAEAKDRVCVAVTGRECLAGEKVELPPFKLIGGGFISGQVVNTATGQSVSVSESGEPIMLGLFGPSQPAGPVISPARLAAVDRTGRFVLRAAPGENFPYFVNTRGVRMAWDTRKQPPVVVKDGETTTYNMLITPEVPPARKTEGGPQARRGPVEAAVRSDGADPPRIPQAQSHRRRDRVMVPADARARRRRARRRAATVRRARPNHRGQDAAPIGIRPAGDRRSAGRAGPDPGHPEDPAPQQQRLRADRRRQGTDRVHADARPEQRKGRDVLRPGKTRCARSSAHCTA